MKQERSRAFTLVEVVLALGVVSFAAVAILGLFPIALTSNRSSSTEARATQLARAIIGTIDSQCATFSNVDCYGLNRTLDLTSLDKSTTFKLYASYPVSPTQPTITTSTLDAVYTIELRFDNNPSLVTSNVSGTAALGAGKVNLIEIRIYSNGKNEGTSQYLYLARNKG